MWGCLPCVTDYRAVLMAAVGQLPRRPRWCVSEWRGTPECMVIVGLKDQRSRLHCSSSSKETMDSSHGRVVSPQSFLGCTASTMGSNEPHGAPQVSWEAGPSHTPSAPALMSLDGSPTATAIPKACLGDVCEVIFLYAGKFLLCFTEI